LRRCLRHVIAIGCATLFAPVLRGGCHGADALLFSCNCQCSPHSAGV